MKTGTIRPRQAVVLLTVTQLAVLLPQRNPRPLLTALPAALLVSGVVLLPLTALARRPHPLSVPQLMAERLSPEVGRVLAVLYGLYFLLEGALSLAGFGSFVQATALPDGTAAGLMAVLVAAAVYGAWMGLEGAARCSGLLLVLIAAFLALMIGLLAGQMDFRTVLPAALVPDASALQSGCAFCAGLGGEAALLAVLAPWLCGFRGRHTAWWLSAAAGLAAVMALLSTGVLGEWAESRPWPFYTAAASARPEVVLRPDALYTVMLTAAVYLRAVAMLIGFVLCMNAFAAKVVRRAALPAGGALMLLLACGMRRAQPLTAQAVAIRWIPALVFSGLLPLLALIFDAVAQRSAQKKKVRS